jgi:hypothetical protein
MDFGFHGAMPKEKADSSLAVGEIRNDVAVVLLILAGAINDLPQILAGQIVVNFFSAIGCWCWRGASFSIRRER